MDRFSALEEIERVGLERSLETVAGLDDHAAQVLFRGLVPDLLERSARDGLFWLRFVSTRDESDPDHSIKPFPHELAYVRDLWQLLVGKQCVVIAKSRQMLVSWIVAAFCVWWARFHPHQAIYWQAQKKEDASAMIAEADGKPLGRCHFIEATLPTWMRLPIKPMEGLLAYPNGSSIQALAGGADQIRGKVMSIYVGDEFAHQEEAAGTWTAVAPLVQKGAKALIVSTPNGIGNQFARLYHGREVGSA